MKYMLLVIFIVFFVAVPMYVLQALVLPELTNVQQVYAQADTIAQQAAGVTTATGASASR